MRTRDVILGLCGVGIIVWIFFIVQPKQTRVPLTPLPELASTTPMFKLTSPAFENNGTIPRRYTCDAEDARPPELLISGAPEGAKSFVLIMEDPDIPDAVKQSRGIDTFIHWVFYDIPADAKEIILGATTGGYGITSANGTDYVPPCPPPQYEPREHRYVFTLYALNNSTLGFGSAPTAAQARKALAPYLLAETRLIGRYAR